MSDTAYTVSGITCDHCVRAVSAELAELPGVTAVGAVAGLTDEPGPGPADHAAPPAAEAGHIAHIEGTEEDEEETMPAGVLTSQAGYTLEADDTVLDGAPGAPLRFRVRGPDGAVVRRFEPRHERELHLVVVGGDLATYAHLHPSRGVDGTWTTALPGLEAGAYRAFADFAAAGGPELILGVDLVVPGTFRPAPRLEPTVAATVDGYDITLSGTPVAGAAREVALTVSRDGRPVDDLEPYLGAFGHLVAIRHGDLAYLHVHPLEAGGEPGGPAVRFAVDVPSPGTYRLFFDFAHGGEVRTAAFTVDVPAAGHPAADAADPADGHGGDAGHGQGPTEEDR